MAKFNFESIEGYKPEMSAEDKIKLLEAYELPAPDYTGYVKKDVLDAKAREAAELSRKLKEKMTEAEQEEAARAAKEAEREELLNKLLKDKTVSESKARFLALGYAEDLASEAAKALADNDNEKLFDAQKKHIAAREAALKAELLKNTPRPEVDKGNNGATAEQLAAMSDEDYYKSITKKE